MKHNLSNGQLDITVSEQGAELHSLRKTGSEEEYMWTADPGWWPRHAPVLFPVVGKLNDDTFRYGGKEHTLTQHGFARDERFALSSRTDTALTFTLEEREGRPDFPFPYRLDIAYALEGNTLRITYTVSNPGNRDLYFSIGAHPGFRVPFSQGESFEDYVIDFEVPETADRLLISGSLFSGKTAPLLQGESCLPLSYDLFLQDAVVLKDLRSETVTLRSRKSDYRLRFRFPGFPLLGIWTKRGAPFLCLEPWCGRADDLGFTGDLREKPFIEHLPGGGTFERHYEISPE